MVEIDSSIPVITGCPDSMKYTIPQGSSTQVVTWIEPTATDNSGIPPVFTQSHQPGDRFPIGTTQVTYTFSDTAGNEARCIFSIFGKDILISIKYFMYYCRK